ncbi:hypothetical protein CEXT_160391 [Caerostris extrusa]|uniref:Uncharacterized protein n=1 Tax=Caerostris extrusa TaxID=172846 RepID=A0AAV4RZZ2_CAEEX|nr:hypothetical protein CEXT_160391 [Caerostris extrusa]
MVLAFTFLFEQSFQQCGFSGPLIAVQGSLFRDLFKSLDPEHDDCGQRVVDCEHYKQPLHPKDNAGQVMFTDPMELESACSEMLGCLYIRRGGGIKHE